MSQIAANGGRRPPHPTSPEGRGVSQRLPWAFVGAALVSFVAIYVTGWRFAGLPVLAGLLVLSQFTTVRLPWNQVLLWTIRVVVWIVVLSVSPKRHLTGASPIFEPDYTNLFACLCAVELVLRAWTRSSRGPVRSEVMLLTALIFAMASNTYRRGPMEVLAPVYMMLMVPCLRGFSRRDGIKVRSRRALAGMRATCVAAALFIGFTGVYVVIKFEYNFGSWLVNFTKKAPTHDAIGLSGAPRLEASWNPAASMRRVLQIDGPTASERHLRVMGYDSYVEGQWLPILGQRDFTGVEERELHKESGSTEKLEFTALGDELDMIALPLETVGLEVMGGVQRDDTGAMRVASDENGETYVAKVARDTHGQGPASLTPTAVQRQRLLSVPAVIDKRVKEIAVKEAGDGDAMERLGRIARWLDSTHQYSLTFRPAGEPLNDFILNNRSGHCQYFASAMVMMARAAGVPARLVTGYYAHEHAGKSQMVVRDRDAHAWTECWIDGVGWVTVDATPAGGKPDEVYGEPSTVRRWYEAIVDAWRAVRKWAATLTLRAVVSVTMLPGILVLAAWIGRKIWAARRRRVAKVMGYADAGPELREVARKFNEWLRVNGVGCEESRTWGEHVRLLEGKVDVAKCREFIEEYDAARFGGRSIEGVGRLVAALTLPLPKGEGEAVGRHQESHHG